MPMPTLNNNIPRRIQINPKNVPEMLHPLIPYAEKWGVEDESVKELIYNTPIEELKELIKAVSEFATEGFDEWMLAGANNPTLTVEIIAFDSLITAYDFAKFRLKKLEDNDKPTS
jgi:hypothetical protein